MVLNGLQWSLYLSYSRSFRVYSSVCELFKSIKSVIGILTAKISCMPCYLVILIPVNRQKNALRVPD